MSTPDWARLVSQGRARAVGISWSDEEQHSISELKIPVDYVRRGCMTLAQYENVKNKDLGIEKETGSKPLEAMSKEELINIAKDKKVENVDVASISDDDLRKELASKEDYEKMMMSDLLTEAKKKNLKPKFGIKKQDLILLLNT